MRNSIDTDRVAQLRLTDPDPIHTSAPAFDRYDEQSSYRALHDDLAELPQAYAAYLDYQQKQWS